jgi:hypothetical protein
VDSPALARSCMHVASLRPADNGSDLTTRNSLSALSRCAALAIEIPVVT